LGERNFPGVVRGEGSQRPPGVWVLGATDFSRLLKDCEGGAYLTSPRGGMVVAIKKLNPNDIRYGRMDQWFLGSVVLVPS
jgi:hypothetical protein